MSEPSPIIGHSVQLALDQLSTALAQAVSLRNRIYFAAHPGTQIEDLANALGSQLWRAVEASRQLNRMRCPHCGHPHETWVNPYGETRPNGCQCGCEYPWRTPPAGQNAR